MNASIGTLLNQMRMTQGWSQRELARKSGVSQSSLTRWEQGRFAPRLPELEAVLLALNATEEQRRAALRLLNAPRALALLAEEAPTRPVCNGISLAVGPMPSAGSLLRAMRLRNGMTRDDLAVRVTVTSRTLRRWENGETWPDAAQLRALCLTLNAQDAETTVLSRGRGGLSADIDAGQPIDIEAVLARMYAIRDVSRFDVPIPCDLQYLSLIAIIWPRLQRDLQALPLLYYTLAFRTRYLYDAGRLAEAAEQAEQVLRIEDCLPDTVRFTPPHHSPYPMHFANQHCEVVIAAATALLASPSAANRRRGRTLLLEEQAYWGQPYFQAWMFSIAAGSLYRDGEGTEALHLSAKAMELAQSQTSPIELLNRQRDHAVLLAAMGRYSEALTMLEKTTLLTKLGCDPTVRHLLVEAQCRQGLYQKAKAHDLLLQAQSLATANRLSHLQDRIQALQD